PDRSIADSPDLAREPRRLDRQAAECFVLDPVLAGHLLHEELRVGDDLDLRDAQLERLREAGQQGAVLGDVVRRDPDRLALGRQHGSVLGLEDEAVRGRAGIAPGAAVGVEPGSQDGSSASGYRSYATSSYGCAATSASTTARARSTGTTVST